ncbi:MAG: hypothetical protein KFB95_09150 [Simkaniaceae bacterium]|nr:MAG: hypothetical protein KFB95_09150 [Simkaniaceae bacterium]
MSNTTIRQEEPRIEGEFRNRSPISDSTQREPLGCASLAVLNHVFENNRDENRSIASYFEEVIGENDQQEDQTTVSMVSMNQLEAYLEKLAKKRSEKSDAIFDKMKEKSDQTVDEFVSTTSTLTSSNEELESTGGEENVEASTTSSNTGGMQAVFDLQGSICSLDGVAVESNMEQSNNQILINNAFQKTANDQYKELQKKLDKLEKEKHSHSIWGFFKGLGSLMKDIANLEKDLATGNMKGISSDIHDIKNNDAVVDLKDAGKLLYSVTKLLADAFVGDTNGIKGSWSEIEQNPSLSLVLQVCAYAAAAAAIVATGGSSTAVVMAALLVLSQIEVTGSDGNKESLFDAASDELAKGLEALHVPDNVANITADVTVNLAVLIAGGVAGGPALAAMLMGTTIASMAPKIAKDSGASGKTLEALTISLEVSGALLAIGGGVGTLSSSASTAATEASEEAAEQTAKTVSQRVADALPEGIKSTASSVQKASMMLGGVFNTMNGAKTIDVGFQQKAVMILQGKLQQTWANIHFGDQMLSNLSDQLKNINSQYSQMIDSFGAIAAPGIATAEALA